jgi:hypothetical protein
MGMVVMRAAKEWPLPTRRGNSAGLSFKHHRTTKVF